MLKLNNISKTFNPGTVNEKTALSGLTLDVRDGDFITIIGANGAGKSTLFNAIAGSFFTDSGSIELDGRDITFMPEHKRARMIGRLFQDPHARQRAGHEHRGKPCHGGKKRRLVLTHNKGRSCNVPRKACTSGYGT